MCVDIGSWELPSHPAESLKIRAAKHATADGHNKEKRMGTVQPVQSSDAHPRATRDMARLVSMLKARPLKKG